MRSQSPDVESQARLPRRPHHLQRNEWPCDRPLFKITTKSFITSNWSAHFPYALSQRYASVWNNEKLPLQISTARTQPQIKKAINRTLPCARLKFCNNHKLTNTIRCVHDPAERQKTTFSNPRILALVRNYSKLLWKLLRASARPFMTTVI